MTDAIDEYVVQQIKTYDEKKMVSVTKDGLDAVHIDDENKTSHTDFDVVCVKIQEVLGDRISKVVVSHRIVSSPSCIVTSEHGWSANMERIMKAQALRDNKMSDYMISPKTMEINHQHAIVLDIQRRLSIENDDPSVCDLISLLYEVGMITSGFTLMEPMSFANRVYKMVTDRM